MGCCGQKRNEWLNEAKSPKVEKPAMNVTNPPLHNKPQREFEYTGNRPLTIIGAASGKSYHFRFKGDNVMVDYHDSFAMMAERELKMISGRNS